MQRFRQAGTLPAAKWIGLLGLIISFFVLPVAVLWDAGVTEDAYITFRVVDNFVHGYGLRWNVHERVQSYSNPLWMLLHIPLYAAWQNIFAVTLILSALCALGTALITQATFRRPWPIFLSFFIVPLVVSPSVVIQSSSGLENPLSHLMYACVGWALFRSNKRHYWLWISFFCALSLVNRLDMALLYAPVLLFLVITKVREVRWRECFLGSAPFVAWELFSLFYYGFFFPNTKYAKLHSGLPQEEYFRLGFNYLYNLIAVDISSAVWIGAAISIPALWLSRRGGVKAEIVWLATGILLYVGYVISVGGNQVSGRFWSLPVFAAIWLIYAALPPQVGIRHALAIGCALVAMKIAYPDIRELKQMCPPCFRGAFNNPVAYTGTRIRLWQQNGRNKLDGEMIWQRICPRCLNGEPYPSVQRDHPKTVMKWANVGVYGFRAGPNVIVVDTLGLADPLLARLPARRKGMRLAGHIARRIPDGYLQSLTYGKPIGMEQNLTTYYEKLRLIVSGDLWSWERTKEIVLFNLGSYDHLVRR